jgi:hypothetical protein
MGKDEGTAQNLMAFLFAVRGDVIGQTIVCCRITLHKLRECHTIEFVESE